jgi:hypothetical protein
MAENASENTSMTRSIRKRATQLLASVAIAAAIVSLTPILGVWPPTAAQAQVSVSDEFRTALDSYGHWEQHPRWGDVWIADRTMSDWRPYTRGRWIYTDEWGWYWDVGAEEADWGWVTYHYGRWVNDINMGWIWIPGDEWAPAWVDWRSGDDYVGWAPLPPDDLIATYRDDPAYWCFVRPRYLLAPRVFTVFVPARERIVIIRRTVIVNRTVIVDRGRGPRRAINAGIEPGVIARATGRPIRASQVQPAVLRGTQVEGGREVAANQGRRARAQITQTNNVIKPVDKVERPRELGANEKGRVGERLSKIEGRNEGRSGDESRAGVNRNSDNNRNADDNRNPDNNRNVDRSRGGGESRNTNEPGNARENRNSGGNQQINVIGGGASDSGRNMVAPAVRERGNDERVRINQPSPRTVDRSPPPSPVMRDRVRQDITPSRPPPIVQRSPSPPPAVQRQPQEFRGGGNREVNRPNNNNNNRQGNNWQQDQRNR